MMDVAVPANMHVGLHQDEIARKGWAAEAVALRSPSSASSAARSPFGFDFQQGQAAARR